LTDRSIGRCAPPGLPLNFLIPDPAWGKSISPQPSCDGRASYPRFVSSCFFSCFPLVRRSVSTLSFHPFLLFSPIPPLILAPPPITNFVEGNYYRLFPFKYLLVVTSFSSGRRSSSRVVFSRKIFFFSFPRAFWSMGRFQNLHFSRQRASW